MNQAEREDLGSIQTRVHHLEQGLLGLSKDVREGFSRITEQFQAQASRIEQDRRPQWQAYGVMLTGIVVLGTMAYWPIREQQTRLETILTKLDDSKVDAATYYLASDRAKENRASVDQSIRDIQANIVPRREHELQWQANARNLGDIQRQVDEIKKAQADTWGARDALMETKSRLRELEDMVLRGRPGS